MSEYKCDPCACPEMHYRNTEAWRKAMIVMLCRIKAALLGQGS